MNSVVEKVPPGGFVGSVVCFSSLSLISFISIIILRLLLA
jgi:hypothetical protein